MSSPRERAEEIADDTLSKVAVVTEDREWLRGLLIHASLTALEREAQLREALREVIGACAPPIEALLMVHGDGRWIAPTIVDGLRRASESLRKNVAAVPPPETEEQQ